MGSYIENFDGSEYPSKLVMHSGGKVQFTTLMELRFMTLHLRAPLAYGEDVWYGNHETASRRFSLFMGLVVDAKRGNFIRAAIRLRTFLS